MPDVLARHRYSFSLIAAAASWGVATVISKRALDEISASTLLPIQLAFSVMILATILRIQHRPIVWSPQLRRLGLLGVLNPGVSYALSLLGLSYITASLSVLLWAIEPIMILLLAWWALGDRVTRPMAGASTVALIGVLLVVFESGSSGRMVGVALTLAGVGACAVYSVAVRNLMADDFTLVVVTIQQALALGFSLLLLAATSLVEGPPSLSRVSAVAWSSALLSGVLYYAVAFWFYLTGLRQVGPGVAGAFINLIPLFGVGAGYLLLAEKLTGRQWLGAAAIVGALGAVVRQQSSRLSKPIDTNALKARDTTRSCHARDGSDRSDANREIVGCRGRPADECQCSASHIRAASFRRRLREAEVGGWLNKVMQHSRRLGRRPRR